MKLGLAKPHSARDACRGVGDALGWPARGWMFSLSAVNQKAAANTITSAGPSSRIAGWMDAWLAVRWRALLTWIVLAGLSGLALKMGYIDWIEGVLRWVTTELSPYLGTLPNLRYVVICQFLVVLNWYQPVALNLGLGRCLLWIALSVVLGISAVVMLDRPYRPYDNHIINLLIVGLLGGVPGLVVIGVRTRPWMTFVGAALAIGLLITTGWTSKVLGLEALVFGMILANLPYAAVMIYGTSRR
jgi:hypothetical protein